ncbi:Tn3 family transposase [Nocardiopsis sp. CA-288880]|uniref:Tn3 family transposase n=1 Tax=Nocardiopsis sp. CA-288880 TaxID=3239995 RepID=UPI003D99D513
MWGQGSTAVGSDSTHVKAFDQNLFTEWHSRYGGRGVLIYWHIEERSMAVHSQLLSCSASEVHAMVEGARRHGTSMNVEANYVDSHGQSEIDRWHAANPLHRQRSLRAFLTWARDTGRLPSRPAFPRLAIAEGQRLAQHRRLELLRRVLDENWASTTRPPRKSSPRPEEAGTATPPATTHSDRSGGSPEEYRSLDQRLLPVSTPVIESGLARGSPSPRVLRQCLSRVQRWEFIRSGRDRCCR